MYYKFIFYVLYRQNNQDKSEEKNINKDLLAKYEKNNNYAIESSPTPENINTSKNNDSNNGITTTSDSNITTTTHKKNRRRRACSESCISTNGQQKTNDESSPSIATITIATRPRRHSYEGVSNNNDNDEIDLNEDSNTS